MKTYTEFLRRIPKANECRTLQQVLISIFWVNAIIIFLPGTRSKPAILKRLKTLRKRRQQLRAQELKS